MMGREDEGRCGSPAMVGGAPAATSATSRFAIGRADCAPVLSPPPPPSAQIARLSSLSLLLLAAAMIACAASGFAVTQCNDRRFEIERHAALQTALDELHAVFGDVDHFDYGQLRLIERRSGLKDLRFETDPAQRERT